MSIPDSTNEIARAQFQYYKSASRLANLWYTLTVIWIILTLLSIIGACVSVVLGAGSAVAIFNSIMRNLPSLNGTNP